MKVRKEEKMFSGMVDGQMDLFGDGWVYRKVLKELEAHNHPLVRLKPVIDGVLKRCGYLVEKRYSGNGRPAYPAGVLLKMLLHMFNNQNDILNAIKT